MYLRRLAAALALLCFASGAALAQGGTARVVSAANAFLATLDTQQRQKVVFAFNDAQQRLRWSNLPITMVARNGINFSEMTPQQRSAANALLAAALSARGLTKVQEIMGGDEALKQQGGGRGGRGGQLMFGGDLYYFSIMGTPSATQPWMLQFGGHHLALNITVAGAQGVLTPSLIGVQPGLYTKDGKTVRPLAGESDKAIALFTALDPQQRAQAILKYRVSDLVLGPGQDGRTIPPEGLKASAMNERQRALLLEVIGEWANIVHDEAATARMAEIRASLNDTWFAWSGDTNLTPGTNITAYYRIQGPSLVIEYAPQNDAQHVHSMYRDPTNDYGRKLTAR